MTEKKKTKSLKARAPARCSAMALVYRCNYCGRPLTPEERGLHLELPKTAVDNDTCDAHCYACYTDRMWDVEDPIHLWFNLTYASYLVLPRSVLQSAPRLWQKKFVLLLEELNTLFEVPGSYDVRLRDDKGRYVKDPLAGYERGRRKMPFLPTAEESGNVVQNTWRS